MTRLSAVAALSPPGPEGWDFSDYPYGLEPLIMPDPKEDLLDDERHPETTRATLLLLAQAHRGFGTTTPAVGREALEQLFWFRWMIGHHISFVLWRLIADALKRLPPDQGDGEADSEALIQYVRAYSGMLLYTGSCTPEIYRATIRPSMFRLHSTFSGTWAPDFPPVRSLFRGRRVPPVQPSRAPELVAQIELCHRIHLGVASKLVESGRSLLQQSVAEKAAQGHRMWEGIFDCYFLTQRAPVGADAVLAQLLRRNKAVVIDLATNGLYPEPLPEEELPRELRDADVLACEQDLVASLFRVSGLAAGLTADQALA
ncbi:hypothetical protein [Streptomyces sp. NRRL WC-3742]|uniref:hypothetical protein n=1 Tax=Streptomyces sp. NRRL WC-3742 TaxID=1463934 RepID=UPI0004CAD593|nr:hypothetical protein [Streptomyces sp. NRRL WC-3742]